MFYKSIRFKMTIVYMAVLALTLSVFSAVLYHYVERSLYENMDTLLRSKAEGIVHAIGTYWEAQRLGPNRYGAKIEDWQDGGTDFATIAQRWVQEKSKDPKLLDIIVQIYDPNGIVVASSKSTQGIASISEENLIYVLYGNSMFATLTPSFPTKKIVKFRVFVTPAIKNREVEYVVQVASPLSSIQTTLDIMKVALFGLFPLTVFLTGIVGAFLAKMTLHPVDSMIKTIHDITAENMKLKLNLPGTRDEIEKLAETFNDMLSRLDHAFTSQKRLFEDLSHDLKTPLTIMKGEIEVALKKVRTSEEYESILRSGLEEVNKIIRLADNMMLLASFEAQNIMPERKELDVRELMNAAVTCVKRLADEKRINIGLLCDEGIIIKGSGEQLKQMLVNLLDNAIKYTPSGGSVAMRAYKEEGGVKIKVEDTGCGIESHQIGHIFDRFYRADKSRSEEGFGLGLSIVKSVVDAHNGKIEAESSSQKGTIFTISLPS